MVRIAVAGGTSPTLGRSIVSALVKTGEHDVLVLSRQKPGQKNTDERVYGAPVVPVDYESVASLTAALQNVDTLVSVVKVTDPETLTLYHSNMLKACHQAQVSRFAPSTWSLGPSSYSKVDLLGSKIAISELCEELGTRKGIECANFHCGAFMNYLGQGLTFTDTETEKEDFALGGLVDDLMLEYIHVPKGTVVIPLSESGRPSSMTMTHIDDIGLFVSAAVKLPPGKWQTHLGMVGDTCSLDDVAKLLKAKGLEIRHQTISPRQCDEKIRGYELQLSEGFSLEALLGKMVAQMIRVQCEGEVDAAVINPTLNQLCPQVKPTTVKEYIDRVY